MKTANHYNRFASTSAGLTYLTKRSCPSCKHIECTAVCSHCGTFKYPKIVAPFSAELAIGEKVAA